MSVSVIIPTIGTKYLTRAVKSVLNQVYTNSITCHVVVDGEQYLQSVREALDVPYVNSHNKVIEPSINSDLADVKLIDCVKLSVLSENTGHDGFNGHRIYAAFVYLVDGDFISFLDEDNWLLSNHIQSCYQTLIDKKVDWCFSLRNICNINCSGLLCRDECESLGRTPAYDGTSFNGNLIDTSCYFIPRNICTRIAGAWNGKGPRDRVYYNVLSKAYPNFESTFMYTSNYSIRKASQYQFFMNGNQKIKDLKRV